MYRIATFVLWFLSLSYLCSGQTWQENLNPKTTPYTLSELRQAFDEYWSERDVQHGYFIDSDGVSKKALGWKQFKRWEWYWRTRTNPKTGVFPEVNRTDLIKRRTKRTGTGSRSPSGSWISVGPSTSSGGLHGIGRVGTLAFREGDANVVYAGTPAGGLWRTQNAGTSWTPLTDDIAAMGVSDILVFPGSSVSADTIFIGTGDRDGGSLAVLKGGQAADNNGIGVLKSVDGGSSWTETGLSFEASEGKRISRLLSDPNNKSILIASVISPFINEGFVYKSLDGGETWELTEQFSTRIMDMEYKPGSSDVLYASSIDSKVFVSNDGGLTWTMSNFMFGTGRSELAVSPAAPNSVWIVTVDAATRGLESILKSTDSGTTWNILFQGNAPGKYLLDYGCDAPEDKGQGEYDLALAVDPADSNKVYLGGINIYRSQNGGLSWTLSSHWSSTCGGAQPTVTTIHADQHYLSVHPSSGHLWAGNDGGVYRSTDEGQSWEWRGNGLVINQIYRIGVAQTEPGHYVTGSQDNGTKSYFGTWDDGPTGDGADCAIDPTNSQIQYGSNEQGKFYKTTDDWATSNIITNAIPGIGDWVTPFVIHPTNTDTLLVGYKKLYHSYDGGQTWQAFPGFSDQGQYDQFVQSIAYSPSNPQYIYVSNANRLRRTLNGGVKWEDVTNNLPVDESSITRIAVKHDDPLTVWVSLGQYNEHGVYESVDGGKTWVNISIGLPEIPVMGVVQNRLDTLRHIYAATDLGVYVKIGEANWSPFSSGLPNVVVTELEIHYDDDTPGASKLLAGTFGRGLWVSDLFSSTDAPVADFTVNSSYPDVNQVVEFIDESTNVPNAWTWEFTPNTVEFVNGTSASSVDPEVRFTAEGLYTVKLTSTNGNGTDSEIKVDFINVSNLPTGYCAASATTPYASITQVSIGEIDNNSSGQTGYEDFSSMTTALDKGSSYALFVKLSVADTEADLSVYADWNRDGDFNDVFEQIGCDSIQPDGTKSFNVAVPAWSSSGKTKLRIRSKYFNTNCGSACGQTPNGQVEDYGLLIRDGVATQIPAPSFFAESLYPSTSDTVQFVNMTTNLPSTFSWEITPGTFQFVNGSDATSANPEIVFNGEGAYDITLIAANSEGSDTLLQADYILVSDIPTGYCAASSASAYGDIIQVKIGSIDNHSMFSGEPWTGYSDFTSLADVVVQGQAKPLEIHVSQGNLGQEDISAWIDWNRDGDFDDSDESIGCSPNAGLGVQIFNVHVPASAALGKTVLRVRSKHFGDGCALSCGPTGNGETEDYSIVVTAGVPTQAPIAEFSADQTTAMVNNLVRFSNESSEFPSTFLWEFTPGTVEFKNGTTATSPNPEVVFTETGTYTVSLTVSNSFGSDMEQKTDYISVVPVAYCSAGSNNGSVGIQRVQLGSIDKSSTLSTPPFYSDFTATDSTVLSALGLYTVTVTFLIPDVQNDAHVWIDFNRNGSFTDPGELVGFNLGSQGPDQFTFNVPADATAGPTVMRVRMSYNGSANTSPCGNTGWGEVEDYRVNIARGNMTWIGITTDWTDPNNWSLNAVPGPLVDVVIPTAPIGGNFPVIESNVQAVCGDLIIESGANLEVRGDLTQTKNE